MKKLIVILALLCILTTGCGSVNNNQVIHTVESHLKNSTIGNWREVELHLSGEALSEFNVNKDRVQSKGSMFKAKTNVINHSDTIAEATSDVIVRHGESYDRLAYNFKLQKVGEDWKIYKVTYSDYIHSNLKTGNVNPKAISVAKEYMGLSFEEKRINGINLLAGKLKQEAMRSAAMPIDENTFRQQAAVQIKVKQVNSLGTAKGFALIGVDYDSIVDGKEYPKQAILEMVEIKDNWKIANIDIAR